MPDLFDMRFIVNTGKGGVGKTTMSIAMATAFARRGKKVLVMQMNAHDRLGRLYERPAVGSELVELAPNIWSVNPTPADAMREYALMILRFSAVYRMVFENRLVSRFLRMMPGLPELVTLGKAYFHEKEEKNGRKVWDVVILDAPATGHGMFLLQIPSVIEDALSSGLMAKEARNMLALLRDRSRTMLNIITLAEELPVNETIELKRKLDEEVGIQVGTIIANHIFPRLFAAGEGRHVEELLDSHGTDRDAVGALLAAGAFRHRRRALQDQHLQRLQSELGLPIVEVPFLFEPELTRASIQTLADAFTRALERTEAHR